MCVCVCVYMCLSVCVCIYLCLRDVCMSAPRVCLLFIYMLLCLYKTMFPLINVSLVYFISFSSKGEMRCENASLKDDRFINSINIKKDHYIETSTVHGIQKIHSADYKLEKCLWLCVLLAGISFSAFGTSTLVSKYYRYEIYTSVSSPITNTNYFPSVTFCDYQLMLSNYYAYCGVRKAEKFVYPDIPCPSIVMKFPEVKNILNSTTEWSNGIFHVKNCTTWGNKNCATDDYFKSLSKHNHTCFTWNYNGNFYDAYGHTDIIFQLNFTSGKKFSKMIALVHDPEITELQIVFQTFLEPSKSYEFKVQKTEINRLKYPFPSNCTDGKPHDIFPGKYTRSSCMESINYIEMLKHCGDIFDYVKRYLPDNLYRMYRRNVTTIDVWFCMLEFSRLTVNATDDCPVPCQEIELYTSPTFHTIKKNDSLYTVDIINEKFDSYKVIQEKQLYTWDTIAGDVGGFLGLIIGASFVSVVELMVYFFLFLVEKCARAHF